MAVTTASDATGDSAVTGLAATLHDHLALRLGVSKWLTVSSRTFVEGSMDSVSDNELENERRVGGMEG